MKKLAILLILTLIAIQAYAQTPINQVAPGATGQLSALLNKPAMVRPAVATPLGRNWFTLETDIHVFTDQVSVRQVEAVITDIENQAKFFNGRRGALSGTRVSHTANELIVDFVQTSIIPVVNIRLRTPFRALVQVPASTDTHFYLIFSQLAQDSVNNKDIKNLYAQRYAQEVTIDGRKYTYIRIASVADVNASILPGAKGTLERNAGPANEEAVNMIINAGKTITP